MLVSVVVVDSEQVVTPSREELCPVESGVREVTGTQSQGLAVLDVGDDHSRHRYIRQ